MSTAIEWAEETWNPTVGCSAVSEGCRNCYAATMTSRLAAMGQEPYAGLINDAGHFNGTVRTLPDRLDKPFHWKKPRRIFVNSMSDLFHEAIQDEFIDQVFAVMALCQRHTFIILTKRAERLPQYMGSRSKSSKFWEDAVPTGHALRWEGFGLCRFPLPNVWLGTSCEDQTTADERIPLLLQTPAAVRFVSAEPLLGPIDLTSVAPKDKGSYEKVTDSLQGVVWNHGASGLHGAEGYEVRERTHALSWIIIGGESGHGARPCNIDWIRSIVQQCKAAGVACFVKQLGRHPIDLSKPEDEIPAWSVPQSDVEVAGRLLEDGLELATLRLNHPKGGEPSEWPEDLRVREWPA